MMNHQQANAHHIAQALKTIASILGQDDPLDPSATAVLAIGAPFTVEALTKFATRLEATAPFIPLTDAEKGELCEELADELSDYSTRERVELVIGDWEEVHWRMEHDDREEQRLADEAEEAGE